MARATVEDCLEKVDNQFKLVMIAGHRARQLQAGVAPKIDTGFEKSTTIALREIAEGLVDENILDEQVVQDPTAEEELAELIAKGLMSQSETQFADDAEDAEEDDIEMDTLETGPQTMDEMEKIADINIDHLMEGDDDPEETTAALAEKVSESERVIGEELLSKVSAAKVEAEAGDVAAEPEQTETQPEESETDANRPDK